MKKTIPAITLVLFVFFALPVGASNLLKSEKNLGFAKRSFQQTENSFLLPVYNLPVRSTQFFQKKKLKGEGGEAFAKGKMVFSFGYGFPNLGKAIVNFIIGSNATDVKATGFGPLHFRGEYGLSDGVGLALSVNYIAYGVKWTTYDSYTGTIPFSNELSYSSLSVLGRINFHFGTTDKLDPYFGVGAGYRNGIWKLTSTDPDLQDDKAHGFSPFGFETTIGLRYYFTEGFGMYTELGIAKSVIQLGLAVAL